MNLSRLKSKVTKERKASILIATLIQLEDSLFLERIEQKFWKTQIMAGRKFDAPYKQVQLKVEILEKKIPFIQNELELLKDEQS